MIDRPLFGEVEPTLEVISDARFLMVASIVLGIREKWDQALVEVQELWQRNLLDEMAGEQPTLTHESIFELILLMASCARSFADQSYRDRLAKSFVGIPLPLTTRIYESEEEARQRRNKEWLANYHATKPKPKRR